MDLLFKTTNVLHAFLQWNFRNWVFRMNAELLKDLGEVCHYCRNEAKLGTNQGVLEREQGPKKPSKCVELLLVVLCEFFLFRS